MPTPTSRSHPLRPLPMTGLSGLVVAGVFVMHVLAADRACAQDGVSSEDDAGWSYRLTPYIWLPSLSGSLRVDSGDPPADVDVDFLELLDFAFLIAGEARKEKWGILGEFNYLALSDSAATDGIIYLGAKVGLDATMGSLFAAYRAHEGPGANLDVLAGARAWWLDLQIDYRAGSSLAKSAEDSRGWVDPVVGLRGQIPATDKIVLTGLADIGGFGVGTDLQWEVLASVSYQFTQSVSASIGYRHLEIDFDDGSFLADFGMSGPYLAVGFSF